MGRHKDANTDLKRLVIDECPDYKHPGKCIWGYVCKHFEEPVSECPIFDKFIPYYQEQMVKADERKHKRRSKSVTEGELVS